MPRLCVNLPLESARAIVQHALRAGRDSNLNPLTVVVLDSGGHMVAVEREDGSGILRVEIARGKAVAALGVGLDSAAIGQANTERVAFLASVAAASDGRFVPVGGGLLIIDDRQQVVGAVGISGDTSDADAACASAAIEAAGYRTAT